MAGQNPPERAAIAARLPIPVDSVVISATHTHSGPAVLRAQSDWFDPLVAEPDPAYLSELESAMLQAAIVAYRSRKTARLSHAVQRIEGLGGNRHDPAGACEPHVPVLVASDAADDRVLAVMLICSIHPTVLHADSTVVSGDFPGIARGMLRRRYGDALVVLHQTGASGNQSPRHVIRANTLAEAARLATKLACGVQAAIDGATPLYETTIATAVERIKLKRRSLPDVATATRMLADAETVFEAARRSAIADRAACRTAECDVLGGRATLALAKLESRGQLHAAAARCLPAGVQVVRIGPLVFVAWPGEWFVEYGLTISAAYPNAFVITLANGELEGYIVTRQAIDERRYEAGSAVFDGPAAGAAAIAATSRLIEKVRAAS